MRISGHKTRAVFDRYNIASPDDLQQAAQKMGRFSRTTTETTTIEQNYEAIENTEQFQLIDLKRK